MQIRRRIYGVLAASLAAFASTLVVAPPASASSSQCTAGMFCMWEHSGYEGIFYVTYVDSPNVGAGFNDKATSVWNRTNEWVTIYQHANYQSDVIWFGNNNTTARNCVTVAPGASKWSFGGDMFNDQATSVDTGYYRPDCGLNVS
ncbi:peptidase inhibitor family I36 protein [Micromonospora fulviviridis]|uniref:Peptidase inhibitor family I36 protein n=1 Tax=Micromonospora fulviviridis TaxID=47860 RepID=A0ABV2VHB6_9ACTN